MNRSTLSHVLAALLLAGPVLAAPDQVSEPEKQVLHLALDLVDGSHIVGVPKVDSVRFDTSFAKMQIPLKEITSIHLGDDHETALIRFKSGDNLNGVITFGPLRLRTLWGKSTIGWEHIHVVSVYEAPASMTGLKQGVVAHYDFEGDFAKSGRVKDASGHGHALQVKNGAVSQSDGVRGQAAVFSRGYLQCDHNPAAGLDHLTISLWFKTANPKTNYKLASAAWWKGGKNASGWNLGTHYPETWADNGKGSCLGAGPFERSAAFIPGEWNHLAITYDRQHFREYINGKLAFEGESTHKIGKGSPMVIGSWMNSFQFKGLMDEFTIWDYALSKADIQKLHTLRQ
jgi:hypothetical protein